MQDIATLYPKSPANVPVDFAAPTKRLRLQVLGVLLGLILFVALYASLLASSACAVVWAVMWPLQRSEEIHMGRAVVRTNLNLHIIVGSTGALIFLFLLKGLFKGEPKDKELRLEITEKDHPRLFEFIRQLCAETKAPFPHRVFLTPEVNAAVFYDGSAINLFSPSPKNLIVGLGLVNVLTLGEFKAVLAHEFGHFAQNSMKLGPYVYTANQIIVDIVYGRDRLDDLVENAKNSGDGAMWAAAFSAVLWATRKALELSFTGLNHASSALSRQMEFNADLVAVSVAGSEAIVYSLARLDLAQAAYDQSLYDLSVAVRQEIYSTDIFYHQMLAQDYLRRIRKDPKLGTPPPPRKGSEPRANVFEPGDAGIPLMWATHPSNFDREQNAIRNYVANTIDSRSPWILFHDAGATRARLTRQIYEAHFHLKKGVAFQPAKDVQVFIDEEHADSTYDDSYHGIYDDRFLEPGDPNRLVNDIQNDAWSREKVYETQANLYGAEFAVRADAHAERLKECDILSKVTTGDKPQSARGKFRFREKLYEVKEAKALIQNLVEEFEQDRLWFAEFDRKVFLLHYQMAFHLDDGSDEDLLARYHFHIGLQDIRKSMDQPRQQLEGALSRLSTAHQITPELFQVLSASFNEVRDHVSNALTKSSVLVVPPIRTMKAGERLGETLLTKPLPERLKRTDDGISSEWINSLESALEGLSTKAIYFQAKSTRGILDQQEIIRKKWSQGWLAAQQAKPTVASQPPQARS